MQLTIYVLNAASLNFSRACDINYRALHCNNFVTPACEINCRLRAFYLYHVEMQGALKLCKLIFLKFIILGELYLSMNFVTNHEKFNDSSSFLALLQHCTFLIFSVNGVSCLVQLTVLDNAHIL